MAKSWLAAVALASLIGCGVETAGTAATAAGIKQRELEEAKKTQQRAQQQIDQATQQMQQRASQPAAEGSR